VTSRRLLPNTTAQEEIPRIYTCTYVSLSPELFFNTLQACLHPFNPLLTHPRSEQHDRPRRDDDQGLPDQHGQEGPKDPQRGGHEPSSEDHRECGVRKIVLDEGRRVLRYGLGSQDRFGRRKPLFSCPHSPGGRGV